MSDYLFVKALFFLTLGEKLDLRNPQKFNEKMQWLKLYDHNPLYHKLVDKIDVKEYVSEIIGEEHIIKTLGVWDDFDSIEWDSLPSRFVLKTSSGGGGSGVIVCKNKENLDKKEARRKLEASMRYDIYKMLGEWAYKGINHRIIAEQYIEDSNGQLNDYKFFCFNGRVKFFKIDFGRFIEHHANYYDCDCHLLPFGEADFPPLFDYKVIIPDNIGEMITISERLSKNHIFLRVDLYSVGNRIFFGEITFYPASGFGKMIPEGWDERLGDLLKLPEYHN